MRPIKGPEREHHRLAYYEFLDCRNHSEVARRTGYSINAVGNWCDTFNWEERAKLYDLELLKKTEKKLIDAKVNRNLKMIKDLTSIDTLLDTLVKSLFIQDKEGHLLNDKGQIIETHGGQPVIKLELNNMPDLDRFLHMKMEIQNQTRKIEGEPDAVINTEVKTLDVDEVIKKYGAIFDEVERDEDT